uniref:immunoglobulin lambda-1 light chain-like isoform X1 n=1 Tax=Pogona vitticeps TaxID=103695 RepID=UPI003BB8733A
MIMNPQSTYFNSCSQTTLRTCNRYTTVAAKALESSEAPPKMARIVAGLGETVTVNCSLPAGFRLGPDDISFYKEKQGQSLEKIDFPSKYSNRAAGDPWALTLRNLERNDSGVYYCVAFLRQKFTIRNGVILIVSGALSAVRPSMLVPSDQEGSQLNHSIPLLCLFFDASPSWDIVSWNIGGETSQEPKDIEMIDEEGALTLWSLKLIAPRTWAHGVSYTCWDPKNRSTSAQEREVPKTGTCLKMLHFGTPCIALLFLSLLLSLLFRKHLPGGKTKKTENGIPMREIPQTEYAELTGNKRMVVKTH